MIESFRRKYNDAFSESKYKAFLSDLEKGFDYHIPFRIAESPVFVPKSFHRKMFECCDYIIDFISGREFRQMTSRAVPPQLHVQGETDPSLFLAIDFGVCISASGELVPQLIELQGFPSLFGWQHHLAMQFRKHFPVPESLSHLFSGLDPDSYTGLLRELIVGKHDPAEVILLEVEPEKQNTRIDFLLMEKMLGISTVCITNVIKQGNNLYYQNGNKKIQVKRIYNRIIFDELVQRKDLRPGFNMTDELNVEWAGHPNWFFRISKFIMPMLKHPCIPESYFVSDLKSVPSDLENYVLKPLFSFSGSGIKFHVQQKDIEGIQNREDYILQRKVKYEPVLKSPEDPVKVELRILFLWKPRSPRPIPVINMARLSKGEMIGVKYNKNKTWVGGSVGFYEL